MRTKSIFPKFNQSDSKFDFDRMKIENPSLWKKLKKQFDTGRQIVILQLNNGLDIANEKTLRYYLMEFTSRFLQFGPNSFPSSFNPLEPFFIYNHHNSILQLHSEEESYVVSLVEFLDFVTDKGFDLNKIDFYDNIPENLIYHFSFISDYAEINFSNNGKEFIIGSLSMARQGNEVSILLQAGESYDKEEAVKYFEKNTSQSIKDSISPSKRTLGLTFENEAEPKVVHFKDRDDLWAHNVAILFDLKDRTIDIRYVARDENLSFKVFTDDFYALFHSQDKLSEEEIKEYYENQLKELSAYEAVFDFAKYCLALPYYVFENEDKIVDINYETGLSSIIKGPVSRKEYTSVPSEYKVFAKPLYYLESSNQVAVKGKELTDDSFKIEKSGYWKRLNIDEEGFDKQGNKIIGKTWVERNDTYYTTPKGVTQVEQIEIFEGDKAGYIYIMRQPAHEENIFKVGLTRRSLEQRKKELSNTSSPDKFFVINSFNTKDCVEAEKQIHEKLDQYRLTSRREFFKCDLRIIMEVCKEIINEINK